jgi:phosphatidate phosphatase PAH1
VVFDIDGTLTPRPFEFLTTRMNAANAVRLYADKGYQIIYLSARSNFARSGTLKWLRRNKFPDGIVNVAESSADGKHPATYKTRMLTALFAKGWQIEYAYGDSSTDFTAYASVPIPPEHVFALQRSGQRACQPGSSSSCLHGWTAHLAYIALLPAGPPN